MKRWKVYLPGGCFTMESDNPREDLQAQGYDAFGLCEITGMSHIPDIPRVPKKNKRPPGGRKDNVMGKNVILNFGRVDRILIRMVHCQTLLYGLCHKGIHTPP